MSKLSSVEKNMFDMDIIEEVCNDLYSSGDIEQIADYKRSAESRARLYDAKLAVNSEIYNQLIERQAKKANKNGYGVGEHLASTAVGAVIGGLLGAGLTGDTSEGTKLGVALGAFAGSMGYYEAQQSVLSSPFIELRKYINAKQRKGLERKLKLEQYKLDYMSSLEDEQISLDI